MSLTPRQLSGRAGGAVTVMMLVVGACGSDTPAAPPPTGAVRVIAVTAGRDLDPDGYVVTVAGRAQAVGVNDQVTVTGVPAGAATTELTGVAPNCTPQGSNPRTISVTAGSTVETTFQVACLGTGSLQVTVTTTGQDIDPDGYTVTAGDSARSIPVSGQVTVGGLQEGAVAVALTGVAFNCAVAGSNPRTVTIAADSTVDAMFDVTCAFASWHTRADMPTARLGLATAVVDGVIYAIGGYVAANGEGLTTVEAYDPATDSWTRRASMPTGRRWLSAAAVNGTIYVIGGHVNFQTPGLATVEAYDPATDTWTTRSDMPTGRLAMATAVVNDTIYVVGGTADHVALLRTVEAYDPATNTWTTRSDMPAPRAAMALEAVNGKLYAIGGGSPTLALSTVEVYDPATDSWTPGTAMPAPRAFLCSGTVGGLIHVISGRDPEFGTVSAVEAYDSAADAWTSEDDIPTARFGLACGTVDGKIYAIGGSTVPDPPHPGLPTVEEFDPSVP